MARRVNYSYERRQRDLAKSAKREAKREARAAAKLAKASPDSSALDEDTGEADMDDDADHGD